MRDFSITSASLRRSLISRRCSAKRSISGLASAGISSRVATRRTNWPAALTCARCGMKAARASASCAFWSFGNSPLATASAKACLTVCVDHAVHAPDLVVAGERELVVRRRSARRDGRRVKASSGRASWPEMSSSRASMSCGSILSGGLDEPRRPFDHRAVGALQHHVEGERVLRQRGEVRVGLQQREGIRAHDQDRERAWIGRQRAGQNLDEARGFLTAVFIEQLLALIDGEDDRRRRRVLAGQAACAMSRSAAKSLRARRRSSR